MRHGHHQKGEIDERVAAEEHLPQHGDVAKQGDRNILDARDTARAADEMAKQRAREARAEQLQADAGDALRRAERDDDHAEEQAHRCARERGGREPEQVHIKGELRRSTDAKGHQHADEGAHGHDALAAEVEDAGALVDRLAQRGEQQRGGEGDAQGDEADDEIHFKHPPFCRAAIRRAAGRGPSGKGFVGSSWWRR